MAFGFPPRYSDKVNLNLRYQDAIDLVKETLQDMHWNSSIIKSGVFSAGGTTGGMDGQPHQITVKVHEYEGIEIISQSLFPWPCYDGGTNKEIVSKFISALSMKSFDREPRFSDSLPNGGKSTKTMY